MFLVNNAVPDFLWMLKKGVPVFMNPHPCPQILIVRPSNALRLQSFWTPGRFPDHGLALRPLLCSQEKHNPLNSESPEQHFSVHHSKKSPSKAANKRCPLRRNGGWGRRMRSGSPCYGCWKSTLETLIFSFSRGSMRPQMNLDAKVSEAVVRGDDVPLEGWEREETTWTEGLHGE